MSTRTASVDTMQRTQTGESRPASLPIRRDLTLAYALSLVIALTMAVASIVGILYQTTIYPTDRLLMAFVPSDQFNLIVGLPVLLASMWLARRGELTGLLAWPGALFYVLYMYVPYVIDVPFNVLFLPYLALVALSAYTLIGLLTSIDGEAVRQRLHDAVPARTGAGILLGLAILIIVRQTSLIVSALAGQSPAETLEIPSWIADFTVAIPMLFVVGIHLWRRETLGYVAGAGLFLGYGVLALSVIPFFVQQARSTASPIDTAGIVTVLVMAALCFVPLAFFARGAAPRSNIDLARSFRNLNATRVTTTTVGVLLGLSGVNHGFFEFLQGNTPTDGLVIQAIGEAQRFWVEGTEEAFTIIPNFLIAGILSMIVGLAIVIWSLWFIQSKHGSTVFLGLFILLFLVGGGIGQIAFFIPAWAFSTRMDKPLTWWKKVIHRSIWPLLSILWVITLLLASMAILMGIEIAIFGKVPGITDVEQIQNTALKVVLSSVILYIVSFIAGFGHDLRRMDQEGAVL